MDLDFYLFKTKQTWRAFAKKLRCNPSYLSRMARGLIKPTRKMALLIEHETKGVVKMITEEE